MGGWSTNGRRALLAAGMAAVCGLGVAVPASADGSGPGSAPGLLAEPDSNDWGTIVPNGGCVQADAWLARLEGIGGAVKVPLFEAHYPPMPNAPSQGGGGADLVDMTIGGIGLGKASAFYTRAIGNKIPADPGVSGTWTKTKDAKCGGYAQAGGGAIDFGLPYMDDPGDLAKSSFAGVASTVSDAFKGAANAVGGVFGGAVDAVKGAFDSLTGWFRTTGLPPEQVAQAVISELRRVPPERLAKMDQADMEKTFRRAVKKELAKPDVRQRMRTANGKRIPWSPIGVHVEGITISALAEPGKPVALRGGAASGYISSFGMKLIDIPPLWPVNFGIRIPQNYALPVIAQASTNEQVTTDGRGRPTVNSKGEYEYDPTATSGYVTAIHASVLGSNAADATVGHAAVARDGGTKEEVPPCATPTGRCARPAQE